MANPKHRHTIKDYCRIEKPRTSNWQGTLLEDILLEIYGRAGFKTSDTGQILGRFNDALRGKAFIFLDEALFGGHRDKADAIKSLVTTSVLSIESKNLPIVQFPFGINLYIATNNDDAIHLDEADARYWILEVSPHRKGDTQYFTELYAEINNGGREAFLHYLLNLDVSDFVPKRDIPLNNAAKEAMIRNSINPYDARKWLEECCRAEMILGYRPTVESISPWEGWQKGQEYPNGIFNTAYTEWQKTVKSPVAAKPTPANKFGELLNKAGLEQRVDGKRLRTLPDPNECLETVIGMIEKGGKK
jgi:phage/plasmid-associated DNA primase